MLGHTHVTKHHNAGDTSTRRSAETRNPQYAGLPAQQASRHGGQAWRAGHTILRTLTRARDLTLAESDAEKSTHTHIAAPYLLLPVGSSHPAMLYSYAEPGTTGATIAVYLTCHAHKAHTVDRACYSGAATAFRKNGCVR
jgi:hypothetical protein